MKKLALLLALLLAAPSALGQSVGASQIKKKANAGLVADSANSLAVGIYRGASAPASPVAGQAWLDTTTTPATLKTYTGSAWEITPTGGVIVDSTWASLPASPTDGQIVWSKTMKRAIVYDATEGEWYYLDAIGGRAMPDYSLDASYTNDFLTPAATTGTVTGGGSVTNGTHICATTFFRTAGGETLPGAATATLTAGGGNNTLDLTIPTGPTGTAGRRVYCSKAGMTAPLFYAGTVADNTTTTFSVTVADSSFLLGAPDVDFSGSLPAGWSVNAGPNTVGGCGSTGASLLCAVYADTASALNATFFGLRLTYAVTGSATGWRARYRLKRADGGFYGSTGGSPGTPVFYAAADPTQVAAAIAYGVGPPGGYTSGSYFPLPGLETMRHSVRNIGAYWSGDTTLPTLYRVSIQTPLWMEWSGYEPTPGSYVKRASLSSNANDWTPITSWTSASDARHLGLCMERRNSLWGGTISWVFEIDRFAVENY